MPDLGRAPRERDRDRPRGRPHDGPPRAADGARLRAGPHGRGRGGRRRQRAARDARAAPARGGPRPQHARRADAPGDPALPRGRARASRSSCSRWRAIRSSPAARSPRARAATCSRREPRTTSSTRSGRWPAAGPIVNPGLGGRLAAGATAELGVGSEFAGHRIEAIAGRGGMGVVYRATDLTLDRRVALKLIAPSVAGDDEFRARFERECRVAASLEHPHVVPIYHAGQEGDRLYVTMRFIEGTDLRALLAEQGRLDPEHAVAVIAQVAGALDEAHRHGLVHRDVKPGNILIERDGGRRARVPHRLRRHQAARGRRRAHPHRHGGRHRRLHVARAGPRRRRRRSRRRLRARLRALPRPHRRGRLRPRQRPRQAVGARPRAAARAAGGAARAAGRARRHGRARARQGARCTPADRGRARGRGPRRRRILVRHDHHDARGCSPGSAAR